MVQVLAVDMVCFYPAISDATLRALCLLCLSPAYPAALATRAIVVVQHAVQASQVTSCSYCPMLIKARRVSQRLTHAPGNFAWL